MTETTDPNADLIGKCIVTLTPGVVIVARGTPAYGGQYLDCDIVDTNDGNRVIKKTAMATALMRKYGS